MYSDAPTGVGVHLREIINRLPVKSEHLEFECFSYSTALNPGIKVNPVKLPFGFDVLKRFKPVHRILWNLFVLPVLARRFDVVYAGSSHGTPFYANQIITIHDLISLHYANQHRLQRYYFKYLLPLIIRSSKKVVVGAEFTKKDVLKTYKIDKNDVVVIHYGGDHLRLADPSAEKSAEEVTNITSDVPFFLVVGCSFPNKNIERVIKAIDLIEEDCRLLIIGAASAYARGLKRQYAANERVIFLDFVSGGRLGQLYKNARANVYVSLYEGFGFPPYEAALHGTVSIVSNTTSLPEIYGDSVYYVDPTSVDEIHGALKAFLAGEVRLQTYTAEFPALLAKYKWADTTAKVIETIEAL